MAAPGLDHRGHHVEERRQAVGGVGVAGVGGDPRVVDEARRPQGQGEAALGQRLLGQEHPADVGVGDEGHLPGRGVARGERPPLEPVPRVGEAVAVARPGHRRRARADRIRASFIMWNMQRSPGAAGRPATDRTSGVAEGEDRVRPPRGSPSCGPPRPPATLLGRPSGSIFGTRNSEMPRIPGAAPADPGQHEVDDVLDRSWSAAVIHIFIADQPECRPRPGGDVARLASDDPPGARTAPWCRTPAPRSSPPADRSAAPPTRGPRRARPRPS